MGQTLMEQAASTRMPGRWLLAFARIVFDESVVTRVIEPTVADFRADWICAGTNRAAKRIARWRGYRALGAVLIISPFVFWKSERRSGMTFRKGLGLVAMMVVLGLATGYAYARMQPEMYRSTAVIQVVPAKVPEGVLSDLAIRPDALAARLQASTQVVLSRTRLERLIKEFDLYASERQSGIMEDVVMTMRKRIDVHVVPSSASSSQFEMSYSGTDPRTVLRVTERLASYFIDESLKSAVRRVDETQSFLEARIQDTASRLAGVATEVARAGQTPAAMPKRLELEVLQNTYKNLLTRREESLATVNLERRQIGEQFNLLDAPQLPQRPIGPTRLELTLSGGGAGLSAGVLVLLVDMARRLYLRRRRDLAGNVA